MLSLLDIYHPEPIIQFNHLPTHLTIQVYHHQPTIQPIIQLGMDPRLPTIHLITRRGMVTLRLTNLDMDIQLTRSNSITEQATDINLIMQEVLVESQISILTTLTPIITTIMAVDMVVVFITADIAVDLALVLVGGAAISTVLRPITTLTELSVMVPLDSS